MKTILYRVAILVVLLLIALYVCMPTAWQRRISKSFDEVPYYL